MTTYTLFGTAIPAGATSSTTGGATYGLEFYVTSAVNAVSLRYLKGSATLSATAQLFSVDTTAGTTGTALTPILTVYTNQAGAAAWYEVSIPTPVLLSPGTRYRVAANSTSIVNTSGYWTTGPGAAGVTSGPLVAPTPANAYGGMQQCRNTATTGLLFPNAAYTPSGIGLFMDVLVDDTGIGSTPHPAAFLPYLGLGTGVSR